MTRGTAFIKTVLENITKNTNFGQCLKNVSIVSAGNGTCKAQFTVSDEHLNLGGTMHGGFTSTLVDCISTYALMTQGTGAPGVSVDLHITFMKAAFPGDLVTVDAKTLRAGKRLAFLSVDLSKNDGKDKIAHGQHTKYLQGE